MKENNDFVKEFAEEVKLKEEAEEEDDPPKEDDGDNQQPITVTTKDGRSSSDRAGPGNELLR